MNHDRSAIDAKSPSSTNPIADISAQLKIVQSALEMVQKRQRILSQAIARWESSGSGAANGAAADGEHADAPPLSKKSKKHQSKDKEERLCGWDERLVWDDTEVGIWSGEQWEGDTCVKGRRCDRHQGWQKTIGASLQVEEALLVCFLSTKMAVLIVRHAGVKILLHKRTNSRGMVKRRQWLSRSERTCVPVWPL